MKNAPVVFSRVVVAAFQEFIHKFLEVYLHDWTVFSLLKDHILSDQQFFAVKMVDDYFIGIV
jgi:hypothetical protein